MLYRISSLFNNELAVIYMQITIDIGNPSPKKQAESIDVNDTGKIVEHTHADTFGITLSASAICGGAVFPISGFGFVFPNRDVFQGNSCTSPVGCNRRRMFCLPFTPHRVF
jgi:hypothetical protein